MNPAPSVVSSRPQRESMRGYIAHHLDDFGWRLRAFAYRFSDGQTPGPDPLTAVHLWRIGEATGIPAPELIRRAEDLGRITDLR